MKSIITFLLLTLVLFCNAQNSKWLLNNNTGEILTGCDHDKQILTKDGKRVHIIDYEEIINEHLSEQTRLIVKFKGNIKVNNTKSTPHSKIIKQFKSDFQKIISKKATNKTYNKINYTYTNTFFGASLNIERSLIKDIKALNNIESVHFDKKVQANNINESPAYIGADKVWSELGYTGKGVAIGIIDTGIDYNHEALGGGFGSNYKVKGGYDFVNQDEDPMDDAIHGTHVAGIAAGNSDTFKGIAPDASLYAYKVLDANGVGWDSDLIAAIEQCVDPNLDGDYTDKLDIVNISLGGSGNYKDPICQAIDNASKAGLIFCVAAGNTGMYNGSIRSPGTAITAITVGASDFNDQIADFSSIGPNRDTLTLKPEVSAPGVEIYSSVLENGYEQYSGTSMACPQVAGLCALIKEAHPNWDYNQMKSTLMTTSKDLGCSPFKQGAGRVQAHEAIMTSTEIEPSQLIFKQYSWSSDNQINKQNITITNFDNIEKQYHISFDSTNPAVSLIVESTNFNLSPNNSITITITIKINRELLDDELKAEPLLFGNLILTSQNESLRIPWVASQLTHLTLKNNGNHLVYSIYNQTEYTWGYASDSIINVSVIKGTYNMRFYHYEKSRYYYFADYDLKENDTLVFNDTITMNKLNVRFYDHNKNIIDKSIANHMTMSDKYLTVHYLSSKVLGNTNLYFNNIDTNVFIGFYGLATTPTNNIYLLQAATKGISDSISLTNNITNWHKQPLRLEYPNTKELGFRYGVDGISHFAYNAKMYNIQSVWNGNVYITKELENNVQVACSYYINDKIFSSNFKFKNDSVACGIYKDSDILPDLYYLLNSNNTFKYKVSQEQEYYITDGPITMALKSTPNNFKAEAGKARICNVLHILGHTGQEFINWDMLQHLQPQYVIKNSKEEIISTGTGIRIDTMVTPDIYTIEYTVRKFYEEPIESLAKLKVVQDLKNTDPTSPVITSLKIINSKGTPTNLLQSNESSRIQFSIADYCKIDTTWGFYNGVRDTLIDRYSPIPYDSISIFIRNSDNTDWILLNHELLVHNYNIGYLFSVDITSFTNIDSATFDIKIVAKDSANNLCEGIWEKAFIIDNYEYYLTNDDYYETKKNTRLVATGLNGFLGNDILNFDYFSCAIDTVEGPKHGILKFDKKGNINYKPDTDFVGNDKFIYEFKNCFGDPDTANVYIQVTESVSNEDIKSSTTSQLKCYPNPFNNELCIEFTLKQSQEVKIKVFDHSGKLVANLLNEHLPSGKNIISWDSKLNDNSSAKSGIYIVQLTTQNNISNLKVILHN